LQQSFKAVFFENQLKVLVKKACSRSTFGHPPWESTCSKFKTGESNALFALVFFGAFHNPHHYQDMVKARKKHSVKGILCFLREM
jgi:hypothetical protein